MSVIAAVLVWVLFAFFVFVWVPEIMKAVFG